MENLGTLIAKLGADLTDLKRGLAEGRQQLASFQAMAERAGQGVKRALSFIGVGAAAYLAFSKIGEGLKEALKSADEFRVTTIGIAATLTNISKEKADPGLTLARNLEFAKEMYEALEEEAAKHFGTAQDLQHAFNILVQKGVIARKEDVQALGLLVDQIKLATQGQNQQIQIAQELRAIVDGEAKATSAVASLLKDRIGPEWKNIVAQHREAGDLIQYLASLFPGLQAALEKIQSTYDSQKNTLISQLRLIGREGLAGAYEDLVAILKDINQYLKEHKDDLIIGIRNAWSDVKEILRGVWAVLKAIYDVLSLIAGIMPNLVGWAKAFSKALQIDQANWAMMKAALSGDLEAARAAAMKRAEIEGLPTGPGRAWTVEDVLAGKVKAQIPPPPGVPEIEPIKPAPEAGAAKGAAKSQTEDLLRILSDYLEAKRDAEVKAAEESLKTLKTEYELKKAELSKALEEGSLTAEEYYRRIHELDASLTTQTLALLDLKIAKEREAYQQALEELEARREAGEISVEAADLMARKLLLEHESRLLVLNAEKTRTRLENEKRLVEILKEQIEARKKVRDLLLDEESKAAFTEIEKHEVEINRLVKEQIEKRKELQRLLAQQKATPEESAAALQRFDIAASRQLQIARFGEEAREWARTISEGIRDLADSLMSGGRNLRQALNKFFKDIFMQALQPGFKLLIAWLQNLFLELFGAVGKALFSGIMMIIGLLGMLLTGGGGGSSWSPSGATTGVTHHEPVRGIVAGETTLPIAQISESLAEALVPTNQILQQIERNTRGLAGGGGGATAAGSQPVVAELKQANIYLARMASLNVNPGAVIAALNAFLEEYFMSKAQAY